MQQAWDAIIVGGGAAGLWAAGTAAMRGRKVLVLEKNNKAGVKILMSGGTRCNITHHCDSRKIAEAFGKQGKVLLSVLNRLSPQDVVKEMEALGVATKVEDTGKVFPASDRAIDVRDAIVKRAHRLPTCAPTRWGDSTFTHRFTSNRSPSTANRYCSQQVDSASAVAERPGTGIRGQKPLGIRSRRCVLR